MTLTELFLLLIAVNTLMISVALWAMVGSQSGERKARRGR